MPAGRMGVFASAMGGLVIAIAASAQTSVVKIDGSSTVAPISEAVAEDFQAANPKIKVTVGTSGTGGGFKKFCRGEIDIADASRPIKKEEMEEAKKNGIEYVELPIAFDALTVVVNRQNTAIDTVTVDDLKKMWEPDAQGKVTTWKQVNDAWPAEKLALYGAGTDSGTFDYFTEAIVKKSKASRGDYTASEDDNVLVRGVEGDRYALGYFGYAYYAAHKDKLKALKVVNPKTGKAVEPSKENVINGTYSPLSRPLFIYVNKKSVQSKPEVKAFIEFYLKHAKDLSEEVKYVPLPDNAYHMATERFKALKAGTVFGGGGDAGMTIEDILKKEASTDVKAGGH